MNRLFIIAGEPSGDLHGAALVRELRRLRPELRITAFGGPGMKEAGARLLQDLTAHAVMGFAGILDNLAALLRAQRDVLHRLSAERPDALVLIDFPDFNLIVAEHAARIGIPVIYYVSPQIWAWRTGRVRKIARCVRKMLVFFEFEKEFYERAGIDVTCVGHPLLDTMADKLALADRTPVRRALGLPDSARVIGLLPGSRRKEILHVYPLLLRAAALLREELPDLAFVTAQAEWLPNALFRDVARRHRVKPLLVPGRPHDVMLASDLLLICSGTATLEAGLLATPMIATYKTDLLTCTLLGPFVRSGNYALVNIVAGEQIVPEFYAMDARPAKIAAAALRLLGDGLEPMRRRLQGIRARLGQPGASARAAAEILRII